MSGAGQRELLTPRKVAAASRAGAAWTLPHLDLLLPIWMELAFHYTHLDDGLALLAVLVEAKCA